MTMACDLLDSEFILEGGGGVGGGALQSGTMLSPPLLSPSLLSLSPLAFASLPLPSCICLFLSPLGLCPSPHLCAAVVRLALPRLSTLATCSRETTNSSAAPSARWMDRQMDS